MQDRGQGSKPRVGFLVNPIAGMGGPVALKGTDGAVEEARRRGAKPVSPPRARRFLDALEIDVHLLTCQAPMGADVCEDAGVPHEVLVDVEAPTSAADTRRAARAMADAAVALIVFVGGDGTALDVAEAIGEAVPALGVPGGVKMNSPVFGETPEDAARVAEAFLAGRAEAERVEVVEVDEARLREGEVERATLGSLLAPRHARVQAGKASPGGSLEALAETGAELAEPGATLVLGPGSTVAAVKRRLLGEVPTLLGVDVVEVDEDGTARSILEDATAEDLEAVPNRARLVVSPIGGQGFILGRGNQQVVPALLDRLGFEQLVVLATPAKLRDLDALHVDTGDRALDARAPEHVDILTGPGFRTRVPLRAGADPDA